MERMTVIAVVLGEYHASLSCGLDGWMVEHTEREKPSYAPSHLACTTERLPSYEDAMNFLISWEKSKLEEIKENLALEAKND